MMGIFGKHFFQNCFLSAEQMKLDERRNVFNLLKVSPVAFFKTAFEIIMIIFFIKLEHSEKKLENLKYIK